MHFINDVLILLLIIIHFTKCIKLLGEFAMHLYHKKSIYRHVITIVVIVIIIIVINFTTCTELLGKFVGHHHKRPISMGMINIVLIINFIK